MLKALGIRYRPQQHAPHLCDDAAHGRCNASLRSQADGAFGEMFLNVYSKWLDDGQGDIEQAKLESFIGQNSPATPPKKQRSL
ncbi:MAG: site-specific integrase, partial [Comamonas sp.]|jgi:integrase|nr:site-specific integrase [Comamonas sp.]